MHGKVHEKEVIFPSKSADDLLLIRLTTPVYLNNFCDGNDGGSYSQLPFLHLFNYTFEHLSTLVAL